MTTIPQQFEASQAGEVLAGFGRALGDASYEQPLQETAGVFREGIWNNFIRTEGPTGAKWPPRVDNLPHPLLFKSGRMLDAAIGEGAGSITEIGPEDALMGIEDSVIEYAKYQQHGTRKMPARPYYHAGSQTLDNMTDKMASETMRLFLA